MRRILTSTDNCRAIRSLYKTTSYQEEALFRAWGSNYGVQLATDDVAHGVTFVENAKSRTRSGLQTIEILHQTPNKSRIETLSGA